MAGSLDKGASAEKRAKTHHDPIFLDTTAAAHLLAGIRQHLQKAVSLSRAEDEQRKLTNELLRKTRLEAAADAERSNENIGRAISISSAAHAELQKILPSWLLRESSESEAEEEEEDSRFKEMEAEIRELKHLAHEAKFESEELKVKEDEHTRLLQLAQEQVDQQTPAILRSETEATSLRSKISTVSTDIRELKEQLCRFQKNNLNLERACGVLREVVAEQKSRIESIDGELARTKTRLSETEEANVKERARSDGLEKIAQVREAALKEAESTLQGEIEARKKLVYLIGAVDARAPQAAADTNRKNSPDATYASPQRVARVDEDQQFSDVSGGKLGSMRDPNETTTKQDDRTPHVVCTSTEGTNALEQSPDAVKIEASQGVEAPTASVNPEVENLIEEESSDKTGKDTTFIEPSSSERHGDEESSAGVAPKVIEGDGETQTLDGEEEAQDRHEGPGIFVQGPDTPVTDATKVCPEVAEGTETSPTAGRLDISVGESAPCQVSDEPQQTQSA